MITPENARAYAIFVKQYARNGEISMVNRPILQRQQAQLELTSAEAEAIERRVLQLLAQANSPDQSSAAAAPPAAVPPVSVIKAASLPSTSATSSDDPATASVNGHAPRENRPDTESQVDPTLEGQRQANIKQYEQEFTQAITLGLPFSQAVQERLVRLQNSLGLEEKEIIAIEDQVLSQHLTQSLAKLPPPTSKPIHPERTEPEAPVPKTLIPEPIAPEPIAPEPTELTDSPPTLILPGGIAYPQMAATAPPAEAASFISVSEMPPELPPTEKPIAALAKSVDAEPVSLRSEKGVDYTPLRDLLRQQKWLDADRETLTVMLKAADRTAAGWLDADALTQFPCLDLHTIDRLWSYYSNGKFGFTAQWHSYPIPKRARTGFTHTLPSRVVQDQVLEFTKKMDWWTDRLEFLKYYNQLNFSLEAPQGHLPALWFWTVPWWKALQNGGLGSGRGGCSVDNQTLPAFMARLRMCGFE